MPMKKKTNIATVLFVFGLLLAGAANAVSRMLVQRYMADPGTSSYLPYLSTVMFCLNLAVYITLLLFWIRSLQVRLLPSRERKYLFAAAMCAVAMLILRSVKYRMIGDYEFIQQRYVWYLYYIPMLLMPTLFLMTCIRIEGKNRERRFDERLLLIPAAVMILLFLTNDLHHFAFAPVEGQPMNGSPITYTNQSLLYIYYGYYALTIGAGLVLVTAANRRLHSLRKAALPFLFLFIMLGLIVLDKLLTIASIPSMFLMPEIVSFGMIGVYESSIRNGLIPHNRNYAGLFASMPLPVLITRRDLTGVYRTARAVEADRDELRRSIGGHIYLNEDVKLSGREVSGGYAFYTEDESELNRLNERITEANELLESENELIQAENELRQRRALIDSRNLVYSRVAERMHPYYLRVQELLDSAQPDSEGFADTVARLNILNAYIKRGTGILLAEGDGEIDNRELNIALEESARYLRYAGIETAEAPYVDGTIDRDTAFELYASFEEIIETLPGTATMLSIAAEDGVIRMVADCSSMPELPPTPLPAAVKESEGLYFFTVGRADSARGGEAL